MGGGLFIIVDPKLEATPLITPRNKNMFSKRDTYMLLHEAIL